MRSTWYQATLFALLAVFPSADRLSAQQVTGRLVGEGERPLAGGYVGLAAVGGELFARTVTDAAGRFALRADSAGEYVVRAEYLGHVSVERVVRLSKGRSETIVLRAEPRAIQIEGFVVASKDQCDLPEESARQAARIWEEIQKAFRVTALVEETGLFRFAVDRWTRELHPKSLRVRHETRAPRTGHHPGSPFKSRPAVELATHGYVQGAAGDSVIHYFAPDARVLLSHSFQNAHCFGLTLDAPEDGWAGLHFQPSNAGVADIAGTLWFDRDTYAPQRLDFGYSRLPWEIGDAEPIGGRVTFTRIPDGPWVVRSWRIRMPLVEERQFRFGAAGGLQSRYGLAAVVEEGGEVRQVQADDQRVLVFGHRREGASGAAARTEANPPAPATPSDDACDVRLSEEGTGTIIGSISSPTGALSSGGTVEVAWETVRWLNPGRDYTFTQADQTVELSLDGSGTFLICGVEPDEGYRLRASAPGFISDPLTVRLEPGEVARVVVRLVPVG